jgi:hypothetical protein
MIFPAFTNTTILLFASLVTSAFTNNLLPLLALGKLIGLVTDEMTWTHMYKSFVLCPPIMHENVGIGMQVDFNSVENVWKANVRQVR